MFPLRKAVNILRIPCPNCFHFQRYATRKRFYRNTSIIQNEQNWEVTLDQRRLKTPNGKVLLVSSEPLARAIAAEWDSQKEYIAQPVMHLTALCNTALDNPGKLTSHDITSYLLNYLPTDTLLFHSDEEDELRVLQEQKWGAILDWFQERFNVKQEVSRGLSLPPVSTETRGILARHFLSYKFPALNAICFGAEALKSPILMLACIERRLDPKDAVLLARLEEEYQLIHWGRVPWAHELNQAELTARVAAALLVVQCSVERHSSAVKAPPGEIATQSNY
ncbi:ATP synthase mitochondrial F1 complex assembly factor 2 [Plodia interpunctella]|uniref:ATP synthase mitochondrial F1 complex assembly factor 2 n=1 Tax=Plodia interpunctella TaxID=58824 RepID=UPI00236760FC|nr:ATP synthase mitochondrial F1 complex assembly factor 2 [Plodia interpunctella]